MNRREFLKWSGFSVLASLIPIPFLKEINIQPIKITVSNTKQKFQKYTVKGFDQYGKMVMEIITLNGDKPVKSENFYIQWPKITCHNESNKGEIEI